MHLLVRHCSPQGHVVKIFVLLQAGLQSNSVPRRCRLWHNQQESASTRTKPSTSTRTKRQLHDAPDAGPLLGRPSHAAIMPFTPCWRPSQATMTLLPRHSHATMTRLPQCVMAGMTPLPRSADAPLTPRWRPSRAPTPLPRRDNARC